MPRRQAGGNMTAPLALAFLVVATALSVAQQRSAPTGQEWPTRWDVQQNIPIEIRNSDSRPQFQGVCYGWVTFQGPAQVEIRPDAAVLRTLAAGAAQTKVFSGPLVCSGQMPARPSNVRVLHKVGDEWVQRPDLVCGTARLSSGPNDLPVVQLSSCGGTIYFSTSWGGWNGPRLGSTLDVRLPAGSGSFKTTNLLGRAEERSISNVAVVLDPEGNLTLEFDVAGLRRLIFRGKLDVSAPGHGSEGFIMTVKLQEEGNSREAHATSGVATFNVFANVSAPDGPLLTRIPVITMTGQVLAENPVLGVSVIAKDFEMNFQGDYR